MPTLHWLNDEGARRAARAVPYRLLDEARLCAEGITFKKIPYELKV